MNRVEKAFAYITNGTRILVFEHADFPSAGIQVPAGTIEPGESPAAAVVREAHEETGMSDLGMPWLVGILDFDARPFGKNELHRRHFFHLCAAGEVSEKWRHYERDASDGSRERIAFDIYWLPLSGAAGRLIADHGALIPVLLAELGQS